MEKKLTPEQIEAMAIEVRELLLSKEIWIDTTIYFNGKAFSTSDGTYFAYNDRNHLIVLEDKDPKKITEYAGDILTMTFEGPLYDCINGTGEYGYDYESGIESALSKIFAKYGCYYELGNAWNLTLARM